MGLAQFRTTEAEEEIIAKRMALRGHTSRSEHFREAYFQAAGDYEQLVGEVRGDLREVVGQIEEVRKLVYRLANTEASDLEMKMLAALLVLVYPSVDASVQAKVDKSFDMGTIETFLSSNKSGRRKS